MLFRPVAPDNNLRARSVHDKRPYQLAVFFMLVHYLCIVALITCVVMLFAVYDALAVIREERAKHK